VAVAALLVLVLAVAAGFGAAFLVPRFADTQAPRTTPVVTPTPALFTPAPSATPSPSTSGSAGVATPSPSASGQVIYVVQRGDSLTSIAAKYGVTAQAIAAANDLKDPNHIEPGQKLIIPTP
jgi:LysM repeat protein